MAAAALARRLGDAERFARAALGFGGRWYDAGRTDEPLVSLLEEALEMLPEGDSPIRARLLARLGDALHFVDEAGRCERLAREAVAMARRTGGGQALIVALGGSHTALLHIDHLHERLAVGAEWLELSRASGHREVMAHALHWRVYDLFERGLIEEALDARRRLQAVADELRQPLYRHFAAAWEAKWLEMAGRFDEAEQKAIESFEQAREARAAYAESNYAGQLFALRRDQGRLGDLRSAVTPLIGEDPRLTVWRTGLLLTILESGDEARARDELRRFRADDFAGVPRDLFWLGSMCLLAEGAAALEDDEAAAVLRRLLEPHADCNAQIGLAATVGPVHRFLGLLCARLGDTQAAGSHFQAALAWATSNGAAPAGAHVQCELADLLREHGECSEARVLLVASRDTARALMMRPLETRAEALLAAIPA
jgi:tetratricopeptide (TPR) repeat protein